MLDGMADDSRTFYKDLPAIPAASGMCDISLHRPVPPDWCVVVVDIVSSTQAIERGQYKDVNTVSASAITAALNAADREEIAYIFGGDGATLLVPGAHVFDIAGALYGTRQMAEESFGLKMRAGIIWVEELGKMNAPVRVARTETAPGVFQAALSGEGVSLAEALVKGADSAQRHDIETLFSPRALATRPPSFKGLECRWQPLQSRNGSDVSLIVQARAGDEAAKAQLYRDILERIGTLCGKNDDWRPVSEKQLHISGNPARLSGEAKVRARQGGRLKYLAAITAASWIGKACTAFGLKAGGFDGSSYRRDTAQHTDYIKFDNVLRLVMDLRPQQVSALTGYLEDLYRGGRIFYGMHAASSALMTCLVFDYQSRHFHFVDGADGGYALAAKAMKLQMKQEAQGRAA